MIPLPNISAPETPTELQTGERTPDDAELLDDLVEQEAEPPTPGELPTALPSTSAATIPVMGRRSLHTTTLTIGADWDATRAIQPDDDRYELHLYAVSETDTDYVLFSDDSSKFVGEGSAGSLYAGMKIDLSEYAGPIWIKPGANITGPVRVTLISVTK